MLTSICIEHHGAHSIAPQSRLETLTQEISDEEGEQETENPQSSLSRAFAPFTTRGQNPDRSMSTLFVGNVATMALSPCETTCFSRVRVSTQHFEQQHSNVGDIYHRYISVVHREVVA